MIELGLGRKWKGRKGRGQTEPAICVVAEAMEEDDCCWF